MKLEEKIYSQKLVYLFRKAPRRAYRIALLYFILAKRKAAPQKIKNACLKSLYWLRKAGINVPKSFGSLNPGSLFEGVEYLIVMKKAAVDARTC